MSKTAKQPSVALVYDRVNTPHGGAENVLLALHQAFPEAPLFTSLYAADKARWAKVFPAIVPSFLNSITPLRSLHRLLALLMPTVFESLNLKNYDIVISVTSAEAKGVLTTPDQLHYCYLLTPTRYLYHQYQHSLDSHWLLRLPIFRQLAQLALNYLRWWDQQAIFRPDVIVPISQRVSRRIKEFHPAINPAEPIYPPVETLSPTTQAVWKNSAVKSFIDQENYFLVMSRLVSHKQIQLAVSACAKLDLPLIIVGDGPERRSLMNLARQLPHQAPILFLRSVTDTQRSALYQHCRALLMPGEEDFGIVALEANQFGKPVLIHQSSGAAECIKPGVHGLHISKETVPAVIKALEQFTHTSFSASKIAQNPLEYNTQAFIAAFRNRVQQAWKQQQKV